MGYLLARLQEPSTYAGIAALLGAFGVSLPSGIIQSATAAAVAGAGLAAVILKERGAPSADAAK